MSRADFFIILCFFGPFQFDIADRMADDALDIFLFQMDLVIELDRNDRHTFK